MAQQISDWPLVSPSTIWGRDIFSPSASSQLLHILIALFISLSFSTTALSSSSWYYQDHLHVISMIIIIVGRPGWYRSLFWKQRAHTEDLVASTKPPATHVAEFSPSTSRFQTANSLTVDNTWHFALWNHTWRSYPACQKEEAATVAAATHMSLTTSCRTKSRVAKDQASQLLCRLLQHWSI